MPYKSSDYPQVKRASQAYDIAKAIRIKAQRAFDETSTTSKSYAKIKADLETAKAKEATSLKTYKSANDAALTDYNKKTKLPLDKSLSEEQYAPPAPPIRLREGAPRDARAPQTP